MEEDQYTKGHPSEDIFSFTRFLFGSLAVKTARSKMELPSSENTAKTILLDKFRNTIAQILYSITEGLVTNGDVCPMIKRNFYINSSCSLLAFLSI